MPSASVRILALLCLAAAIMNAMKCFVSNLLYTSSQLMYNYDDQANQYQDEKIVKVDKKYVEVYWGGRSLPSGTAVHKVALIVPYRDRPKQLAIFLNYMHPFLMKQPLKYRIFVVEQEGKGPFNRGKLMNVGFLEAGDWPCFIFHDVDLLPLDERNLYSCSRQPRHLSAAIDKFNFELPYTGIFGGVSALTPEQFKKVNGFSNRYWGWGGEDDDMSIRHQHHELLLETLKTFKKDGLSSLKYTLRETTHHHLYTRFLVNIDESQPDNIRISYYSNMLFGDVW